MDDNTTKVIMAIIALISAIVTPLILLYVTKKQNEKLDNNQAGIVQVAEKVDTYHKEVNGKMGELLETTKQLATAKEKARADAATKKQ